MLPALEQRARIYNIDEGPGAASSDRGAGTVYTSPKVFATYMRIDGGTALPGYLTAKAL